MFENAGTVGDVRWVFVKAGRLERWRDGAMRVKAERG